MDITLRKLTDLLQQAGIPPSTDEDIQRRQQELKAFLPTRKRKRDADGEEDEHGTDDDDDTGLSVRSVAIQVSLPCALCHHVPDGLNPPHDDEDDNDAHPHNDIDVDWEPEFDDFEQF